MRKDTKFGISDKRGRASTTPDPYAADAALKEPSLCRDCHALYRNKRWAIDPIAYGLAENDRQTHWVTCPACRKIADGYAEGIVTLAGDYLLKHEEEIRNILKNEEKRVMAKNPLERIIRMEKTDGELRIETTEQKLAEHLGRVLHRAHQGELQVNWSRDHAVCRVHWERPA
jgi:NMD protein affecting ribosome stability and mRNA decay